eukprot:scaffold175753_cov63-Attheya_sp.AAC.2
MAPNQTALSATTMSPFTTDATSHNPQSLEHQPCVYSAFSSKRRRIRHPSTTIPAVIRIYVPGFVIDASSTLPLAAVGGDHTVTTTGSTIYHTLVENSLNRATSMPNHVPQRMLLHPTVATSPSRPYPSIVAGNPAHHCFASSVLPIDVLHVLVGLKMVDCHAIEAP